MKIFFAVTVVTLISGQALGFSFLKQARQSMRQATKDQPAKVAEVSDCADLSGHWKGVCSNIDGETNEDEIVIKQNECKYINIEENLIIGGINSASSSGVEDGRRPSASTSSVSLSWNAGRTGLYGPFSFLQKELETNAFWSGKGIYKAALAGERLVVHMESDFDYAHNEEIHSYKYWYECSYERVEN